MSSVKLLKAFARVASLPSKILITFRTGVKILINPCPTVALRDCNCNCITRTWFAQLSDVRMKSPDAADNCFCTKARRRATFSCSVMADVVLPYPFASAYWSSADWVITTPRSLSVSVSPVNTDFSLI